MRLSWLIGLLVAACGGEDGGTGVTDAGARPDAAAVDSGHGDATPSDGSTSDGAPGDASALDATAVDAPAMHDATSDAGSMDAGGLATDAAGDATTAVDGGDGGDAANDGGAIDASGFPADCIMCHGDVTSPAPPLALDGTAATTGRGVGAHRSHLRSSTWHREVVCTDCHLVPVRIDDPGHIDTPVPAELTWGDVPLSDSAAPSFDGTACSGVYCHGATLLPGGSNTTPIWARVNGTQAACGTCHGAPPAAPHPPVTGFDCSPCHPTIDAFLTFIEPSRHIDGVVDVVGLDCTSCHGSAGNPSPPLDTTGGSATTRRGVGAHRSHLGPSTWHAEVTCDMCHRVPAAFSDPGHMDTPLPAELAWGARAVADTASPAFDGTACSGVYCHGATLLPGGSDTTPQWTRVDGTQAACGTCHGLPPGGMHPTETDCSICHSGVIDSARTIVAPALHVNGVVDRTPYHSTGFAAPTEHGRTFNAVGPVPCQRCHGATLTGGSVGVSCETCHSGWQTHCTFCHGDRPTSDPAPPQGVDGETSRTVQQVGAHQEHVSATTMHIAWDCDMCHGGRPTSALSAGHIDGDGRAEVVFGPIRGAGTTYDGTTGTCGSTYCHGNGTVRAAAPTWPSDPTLDCGSCHAPFSGATATQLRAMSGEHDRHVRGQRIPCSTCHDAVVSSTGALLRVDLHVDGIVQVGVPSFNPADPRCGGGTGGGCTPTGCHGHECW